MTGAKVSRRGCTIVLGVAHMEVSSGTLGELELQALSGIISAVGVASCRVHATNWHDLVDGRSFDGTTRRSPQSGSRSSGERPLTLVSPSYFEGWKPTRERVPCARPKVFAFAFLPATKRERFLQESNGHLTPGHRCSTTLCLVRERFLHRELRGPQGSADHGSVFVVFFFGRMRGEVVLGILMRWC